MILFAVPLEGDGISLEKGDFYWKLSGKCLNGDNTAGLRY
jgi:hypothetical protein